ncbi:hypothetical protein [Clostridium algidicarnis]|uniref:hypothetical protein n=1 Tax=Clostridium algidicarnis TaxID=37659 RepID=UPI001C0D17E5|nr:hypothetical protein [Clostridium algidicarnis]MBU3193489.1 hypothetical protein [Clostridium algidicarnis]MBU3203105.1 hypothetical protein [Clostridium algidicarnis]MBU3205597.1 hypothetical protein [Clostridium algidicarnis]MBU3211259.1 hypothetical protein [Clostridium algidicarnis]MBU3222233.1 hypothetical protein [Clostridium algidicarnis]
MKNKAFKAILEALEANLNILNYNGFEIYDAENRNFYIESIEYNKEEDKIFVNFMESCIDKGEENE